MPVVIVAQKPPMQWVANESPLSTHFTRFAVSVNLIFKAVRQTGISVMRAVHLLKVPMTPKIAADVIPTKPAAGVMNTRPDIAPRLIVSSLMDEDSQARV